MTRKTRSTTLVAVGLGIALAATGCAGGGETDGDGSSGGKVSLTVWENASPGPGEEFWKSAVQEYMAENPKVSIKLQTVQNEDFDGKLQTALNSNSAPDIFLQRGGGKLRAMVEAGQLQELPFTEEDKKNAGAAVAGATVDGKIYTVPLSTQPEGIYYSKELFEKAGIKSTPTTMDELEDAIAKLKKIGVAPIAVGAKDAWPAAHWYYNFALRHCSQDAMSKAAADLKFDDPCWKKAGEDLQKFLRIEPFQKGYLTTPAQQGAGSSAGMLANHKAGMELMGNWNPGVIAGLTPDKKPLPDLGWFPFPAVDGGQGNPSAMMGGSDGYSVAKSAPKEAFEFLQWLSTKEQQEKYAKGFNTIPVNKEAQGVVTDPYNVSALEAFNKAAYTVMFLDTEYGQNVGNAMNTAVVNLMAGKGTPEDIVKNTNAAAAKG
ncbi:ABC transporter substrate-binding protein [Streptomyces chilikensis]|uniref:Extracellular solute-binding protein n=1 Tax=Streptomyces chilikensis TaxID=1194079 RepID=A0ABV3ESZ8_9ACTN